MHLRLPAAGLAAALLAACGGDTPETETETPAADVASTDPGADQGPDVDAIFADYAPWDASRDGIQTTESGLQYIVLKQGPADALAPASPRDRVTVMYDGRIAATGEKFDSSYDRGAPATFGLGQVIRGWTEGLQLMKEGDLFLFFIPAELGYGDNPRPGGVIKPGDDLMFLVDLNKVIAAPPPREADGEAWASFTPWDSGRDGVTATGSGLEYVVLESGDEAGATPAAQDNVVVHYEGRLAETGETFDSSFPSGQAAIFPAGRLIPGFSEALQAMRPGDRWLIYIPSDLAYGEAGTPGGPIPPNADLIFELELQDILQTR